METSTSLKNINPRISFPICIDHERQVLIPQYIHPTITSNIDLSKPRNVLINPKTGQEERFREKWSEKENILFFEYLSVNFYQWQFHKGEFYKWLSNNVFKKYSHKQIETRWSQICTKYNKVVKERQKGINNEWIYFDKVQEIMARQNLFNQLENDDDDDDNDGDDENNNIEEDTDQIHERILGGRTPDENEEEEIDDSSDDEYGKLSYKENKTSVKEPWTFEEKILLLDIIKEHVDEFLQDRVKLLKWISENHLPKFHWKTIRNKLYMLLPNYTNKKARLKKKNITEQDLELWTRIDDFFQFLNNKKKEMKTKGKKKYNYYKKRQKTTKNERKRNPKTDLTPFTLKQHHGISYDDQKLLKYGHSLLKYADEKNIGEINEISEIIGVTRWPEKTESLKVIPPKYIKMDISETKKNRSSLTHSKRLDKAEQLIFKPNFSDDTFNLMIKYLMTPFKGGLTGNIDTFIDQEVREMVNSIDKSRGEYKIDEIESEHESVYEENDYKSEDIYKSKRYECQGKKRKRVIDVGNVKKNNVMDYECDLESIHESNHSDDFKRNQQDKYKNPERKKKPRVTEDINKNDIIDYGYNYEGEREEGVQSEGNDENESKRLFCYKCGTAEHLSKYCSLYSSECFSNMRKRYSSVFVEFALRQLLDSIGFIFQNNIHSQMHCLYAPDSSLNKDHIIEDDGEINDLFQTEVQGESGSTSVNHPGINFENIYPCTTNSANPTGEPTIRWDTVLRAAGMAGFDATTIKNTYTRVSKYFDKENRFEDFTSILESSRNNVDSTDYLDGPDQLNIWV
ncbi:hypothetical protein RclHR1_01900009 [Rhizophagus clarus]|uniref:CCHC-type domain-containing protein n=1 Tax=Rhizophagus clarus TaxID=94130 RepID=A0A2Z6R226_9GLOM|nr:hypothetical protein RclHR1_01900009 [Rhizophagus clarus]GES94104.1 hypothetical protein GLOIN_2v1500343 [Rhizophagus clarus]